MIRRFCENDLTAVMEIWLETNIRAHDFIGDRYWKKNLKAVEKALPEAEVYVCEDESGRVCGFIGLTENHIEGLFVKTEHQSKGAGKQLLDHVKKKKSRLSLNVYQKNTRAVRFYEREGFKIQSAAFDSLLKEKEWVMGWEKKCLLQPSGLKEAPPAR